MGSGVAVRSGSPRKLKGKIGKDCGTRSGPGSDHVARLETGFHRVCRRLLTHSVQ